jgi:hypothetical protein
MTRVVGKSAMRNSKWADDARKTKTRAFTPGDFEYDFDSDKLAAHRVEFEEAVECFFSDFVTHRENRRRKRVEDHLSVENGRRGSDHHRMGDMSGSAKRHSKRLSEDEIDDIVVGQMKDDATRAKARALSFSPLPLGSGRPRRLPSSAPHRSGRAGLPHPALRVRFR